MSSQPQGRGADPRNPYETERREDDLHAYVDGCLPPEQHAQVRQWLACDPEAAARVAAWREQREQLQALFAPVLAEPLPPAMAAGGMALVAALESPAAVIRRMETRVANWPWGRVAASVVLVLAGVALGTVARDRGLELAGLTVHEPSFLDVFVDQAAEAHRFYAADDRFPVEMGADDPEALDSRLSQRLGQTVFAPNLDPVGYKLIGGRSLPSRGGNRAQYMYENDKGKRLTVFAGSLPEPQASNAHFSQRGDIALFRWTEGSLAYAVSGPVGHDELLTITRQVSQDLRAGTRPPTRQTASPETPPTHEEELKTVPVANPHTPKDS